MRAAVAFTAMTLSLVAVQSADAKGCIKGAIAGGVAGHYAGHHGVLGAAAGCAIGRHETNKHARQQQDQPVTTGQSIKPR